MTPFCGEKVPTKSCRRAWIALPAINASAFCTTTVSTYPPSYGLTIWHIKISNRNKTHPNAKPATLSGDDRHGDAYSCRLRPHFTLYYRLWMNERECLFVMWGLMGFYGGGARYSSLLRLEMVQINGKEKHWKHFCRSFGATTISGSPPKARWYLAIIVSH